MFLFCSIRVNAAKTSFSAADPVGVFDIRAMNLGQQEFVIALNLAGVSGRRMSDLLSMRVRIILKKPNR